MSQDYNNPAFKKLLQKLQEESWQLELLISGFAIFGLFQAIDPIGLFAEEAKRNEQIMLFIIGIVSLVSCYILLFNLLLHVILRGLWIGALGLRYVSGDIDYEELKYSPKFTNYLKKKIGSFDRYIGTLENYCSIIFAISFLLIFYVLAFTMTIAAIALVSYYILNEQVLGETISTPIGVVLIVFIVFGMFFTFIDFVTQGWLKKKKWTTKFYFPIYWVFSFITLSFLYRPLVHNFLDNKFGKRLSWVLLPIYLIILISTSFTYKQSNYINLGNSSSETRMHDRNYEALINRDKGQFIRRVAIPSKVITQPYLKIFVVFDEGVEDHIFELNSGLKPEKDIRGLSSDVVFSNNGINFRKRDSLRLAYIKTFNDIYHVYIDSTEYITDFILGRSSTKEFGFETYIAVDSLPKGKHILKVNREFINRDNDTAQTRRATIPFWYFKD
ncbi:hypothetical protein RM697_11520 [Ichthyenterobacterium sp. W332]|uniref:Uncharacterized protein n=1 Tax=Microcosmobacter mediterraneus TaxID=3075607 RepID=A0ABU2YMA0_9FLAO|nr:hypothetical protein [Ichthyenterobacterium sp. W332]MDT0559284.1 hypothetical protein [Ichthyenterobacterium sp. W332]